MKKNNNVHIYPSTMEFSNRIFKISTTIKKMDKFDNIFLLGINDGTLKKEEVFSDNIIIHRLELDESKWLRNNLLYRIHNVIKLSFLIFNFLIEKNPKVVHAHNLATLPISIIYKTFYKCKVVYDTHELETERQGWTYITRMIGKFVERIFIKFADVVVVVNEKYQKIYKKTYGVDTVSIMNTIPYYELSDSKDYLRKLYKIKEETLIFTYVGVFSNNRGIKEYMEYFKKTKLDICCIFIGYGKKNITDKMFNLSKNSNKIFIHEGIEHQKMLNIINSSDYSLQTLSFSSNLSKSYKYGLGNKFFESCIARLPMIGGGFDLQKKYINKFSLGVVVESDNFQDMDYGFRKLISMNKKNLEENCINFLKKNSWENEEKKIDTYYKEFIL